MNSDSHGSEEKLAEHGCAGHSRGARARVLIGGLGMGFTARAALDQLGADARVRRRRARGPGRRAMEPRSHRAPSRARRSSRSPPARRRGRRRRPTIAGARRRLRRHPPRRRQRPPRRSRRSRTNAALHARRPRQTARRALRPNGVLALWSAFDARPFTARLGESGFDVTVKRVRAHGKASHRHVLWLARCTPHTHGAPSGTSR